MNIFHFLVQMIFRLLNLTEHEVNTPEENGRHSFSPNKFHRISGYILSSSQPFFPLPHYPSSLHPHLSPPAVYVPQFSPITSLHYSMTPSNDPSQVSLSSFSPGSDCCLGYTGPCSTLHSLLLKWKLYCLSKSYPKNLRKILFAFHQN